MTPRASNLGGSSSGDRTPANAGHLPRPSILTAVRRENHRTVTITLADSTAAEPGQFAMLWLPGLDEKPFSLLNDSPLSFTIAAVGPFSRAINRLRPGATVWWRGPFGRGFDHEATAVQPGPSGASEPGSPIFVGGGYGVAPLCFKARRTMNDGSGPLARTPRFIIGARTAADVLLVADLNALGIQVAVTTEDGTQGERGLATDALRRLIADDPPVAVLACGPHGMLHAVGALAAEFRVPAQLSWEAYMRCGIGICGSCEHGGMLLCADGPVLTHRTGVG